MSVYILSVVSLIFRVYRLLHAPAWWRYLAVDSVGRSDVSLRRSC